jgi:gluconolactonase
VDGGITLMSSQSFRTSPLVFREEKKVSENPHVVLDPRFNALIFGHTKLEKLWTGARWLEGPAYFPAGRYLIVSDIPNDRLLRFDETDSTVSVFRSPCFNENGHTVDRQGRLISCEHRGRAVTRTEFDGSRTVLAAAYRGKKLNSPNDVVVKSDGSIWFTDPSYGIDSEYEGDKSPSEQDGCYVYRIDPDSGDLTAVITDMHKPNGLAFSPDESLLYVADTATTHDPSLAPVIRRFRVSADAQSVADGKLFATCQDGLFDGFRVDTLGHIWTSTGAGVECYHPDGTLLGRIPVPEIVGNVSFGGPKHNRLYICGQTSLYSLFLRTQGPKYC